MNRAVRCVVVDDSRFYRNVITTLLTQLSSVEVVGSADSGEAALNAIRELSPDLVTLDVEMPGMNGLVVLEKIRERYPHILVIMISAATRSSARITIEALQRGALDFIEKPVGPDATANERQLYLELRRIASVAETKLILRGTVSSAPVIQHDPAAAATPPDIVAVGISTGGPAALPVMLADLPGDFPLPIAIVQHMPPMFVSVLAESLGRRIKLRVLEATDGLPLQPGTVYLAPGGRQTKVTESSAGQLVFELNDDAPENFCRPSIDYLFRSLAELGDLKVLAVIMTGMGRDGVTGLKLLKQQGAMVLAQDESSSTVYGMPMEACKAGCVDQVLPLDRLGAKIRTLARYERQH